MSESDAVSENNDTQDDDAHVEEARVNDDGETGQPDQTIAGAAKVLPKELTSYDLLKMLAVVLMIIDHIGFHFYPDEMWYRVIGRWCVPIWFFLIGYAKTEEITRPLVIGAVLIAGSAVIMGQYVMPFNILVSIIVMRWARQGVFARSFYSAETLRGMYLILLFLTLPTAIMFEYGAIAMMFVMCGHMVRYRAEFYERIEPIYIRLFYGVAFFTFALLQSISFPVLSNAQALSIFGGFFVVAWILWFFKAQTYPQARGFMAGSVISIIQFFGRRTLEIYVAHVLLFRGIAAYLYPEKYQLMDWQLVPPQLLSFFIPGSPAA